MIDLRFPTALQLMLFLTLASRTETPSLSSAQLAQGIGIHASFVRKLLVPLAQGGLIVAARGKSGGVRLARPAEEITLRDIYQSILREKKIWEARLDSPRRCLISTHTPPFFEALARDAEQAVLDFLGSRTLADSLAELEILDKLEALEKLEVTDRKEKSDERKLDSD